MILGRRVRASLLAAVATIGCSDRVGPLFPTADPARPLNVVLVSLDTLRPDHLGCYGYPRPTSPNIDRLAAESTVFERAYSVAPKTAESHMSMLTGLYPSVHGVRTASRSGEFRVLDPKVETLPEILRAAGYRTAGFHAAGMVHERFGFGRGFDTYTFGGVDKAAAWLTSEAARPPFFLFFHTYRVHDPYTPSPPFDRLFEADYDGPVTGDLELLKHSAGSRAWSDYSDEFWSRVDRDDPADVRRLVALYDGVIAELDASLAILFAALEPVADETVVVLLSDHGEEFLEHGEFRHRQLYEEILRVPLIIRHPRVGGPRRIEEPVSLIGLAPTLLELVGLEPPAHYQSGPWRRAGRSPTEATVVFSELPGQQSRALLLGRWKLIATQDGIELYDRFRDPGESGDLVAARAAGESWSEETVLAFRDLSRRLERIERQNLELATALDLADTPAELDPAHLEQLRALGYVE